ncbi:MAG TPA: DUF4870 domain-containing protein [Caulobacteraceae bacterium]|nr:DUF4870 domain-containing protein [Caulobacteraceae bacterium]
MTDTPSTPLAPVPSNNPLSDERQMAMIVYIAYLAAFAFPVLALVGLVLAYVNRDAAPDWLKSHYAFQIRTFWIGLLYWVVSILFCVVLVGFVMIFATIAWYVVRCALGINRLMMREAYPNPDAWIT